MRNHTGYLTVFSADQDEIYGEFADASWDTEDTEGGTNHLFSGTASEGTVETFRRLNSEGIANLSYTFDAEGARYTGSAQLLAPDEWAGHVIVRIESGENPQQISAD